MPPFSGIGTDPFGPPAALPSYRGVVASLSLLRHILAH